MPLSINKRHCKCRLADHRQPHEWLIGICNAAPFFIFFNLFRTLFFRIFLYGHTHFINHRFEYLAIFIKSPFAIP